MSSIDDFKPIHPKNRSKYIMDNSIRPWWFYNNNPDAYGISYSWEDGLDKIDWIVVDPPIKWQSLTVIGDRHLPNGFRQHLVEEQVVEGLVIDNCHVIAKTQITKS